MPDPGQPPPLPSVLRLVQSVVQGRCHAGGEDLYRELAHFTEAAPGKELLVAGCGDGIAAEWLAARTGATVTGLDADAERIARAERRRRAAGTPLPVSFEHSMLDDLPHETGVFDAAIGEPPLSAAADPARAVAELVRVTKPMGVVVLVEPTWSAELTVPTRELLVQRLGLRPHLLIEWKQMLRDAGVVDIQVQDWTEDSGPSRRAGGERWRAAAPDLSWSQKVHIVGRAWRQWGLRSGGLRAGRGAVEREVQLLRALARERSLCFALVTGVKWPHQRSA